MESSANATPCCSDDSALSPYTRPLILLHSTEGDSLYVPPKQIKAFDMGRSGVTGVIVSVSARPSRVYVDPIGWIAIDNIEDVLRQYKAAW
jgi:hypothetical protein